MAITASNYRGVYSGELPFPEREKRGNGGGDDADRWVPPVGEGKRERGTGSGSVESGPWAASVVGPDRFPGALFYFYFLSSFPFSISVFLNLS
jgi:hypothetical protein